MTQLRHWACLGVALSLCACHSAHPVRAPAARGAGKDAGRPGMSEQDAGPFASSPIAVHFTELAAAAGLTYVQAPPGTLLGCEDFTPTKCPFTSVHMSGGAAAGDFDGDGLIDLYATRIDAPGVLYRNRGDGTFEDVTDRYGLAEGIGSNGAAFADIDNDGDLDLYVTSVLDHRFYLFRNQGDHFEEQGASLGADVASDYRHHGFGAAFGDFDRDGFLDLHTTEWVQLPLDDPRPSHARLLHNLGSASPGSFEDVTGPAGVDLIAGTRGTRTSFASSFADMDGDGWPELLVVADFNTSRLFWNDGHGAFNDGTLFSHVGTDLNGMGTAIGDYDGDGDMDWFVTGIFDPSYMCSDSDSDVCGWGTNGNRLYQNRGDRSFRDVTDIAGVRDGGWGWGAAFFDYDNDGDLDLVMTNGVDFPYPEAALFRTDPMRLFRNDGNGTFTDVAVELGIDDRGDGKGLLVFDYDDDGDQDLLVVQHEGTPHLYRNDGGNQHAWLRVRLRGTASNRDGVGARLTLVRRLGEAPLVRDLLGGTQFLGQSESVVHFGLGDLEGPVRELQIQWPSGRRQILRNLAPRQTLLVVEGEF
ncbi:MAG: CRTAC1 family protein [Polyangiales bacterium]